MLTDSFLKIFKRNLNQLKTEISTYPDEASLWKTSGDISNSAGNLTLHLIGNLKHYIGAVLGKSGYVRNRPAEFADKHVARTDLLLRIDETIAVVQNTLPSLSREDLQQVFPEQIGAQPATTEETLIHLTAHLAYHLGQINYHRRLIAHE